MGKQYIGPVGQPTGSSTLSSSTTSALSAMRRVLTLSDPQRGHFLKTGTDPYSRPYPTMVGSWP